MSTLFPILARPGAAVAAVAAFFVAAATFATAAPAAAADLPTTVAAVKPSIVGVGTYLATRSPAIVFSGTGWVTADGLSVVTNSHVVPEILDTEHQETLGIITAGATPEAVSFRPAKLEARDPQHDLAHLRLSGAPLPALALGDSGAAREGQSLAFTGFPLGMVLGLHPATHRATLSAITPLATPALSSHQLTAHSLRQLQQGALMIFQLDGTAYPGNSGSPLYDPDTGAVLGVINMVFVKGLKETAITNPSGISYAIPAIYVRELLNKNPLPK